MVKKKDYFTAIVMGTFWVILCLLINFGFGWVVKSATDNITAAWIFAIVNSCVGLYMGRDFFKPEMRTVRADDPKTDWWAVLRDVQLILIASIYIEAINSFRDGFSWLGLGSFVCGLILVGLFIHMRNTRFGK